MDFCYDGNMDQNQEYEEYSDFGYYCSTCGAPVESFDGSMTEAVVASLHRGRIPQQWAICTHCGSDSGFTTNIPKD